MSVAVGVGYLQPQAIEGCQRIKQQAGALRFLLFPCLPGSRGTSSFVSKVRDSTQAAQLKGVRITAGILLCHRWIRQPVSKLTLPRHHLFCLLNTMVTALRLCCGFLSSQNRYCCELQATSGCDCPSASLLVAVWGQDVVMPFLDCTKHRLSSSEKRRSLKRFI